MEAKTTTKVQVLDALKAAQAAPFTPARASGCGRAYVCISSSDRALVKAVKDACKTLGLIFTPKGYGVGRNAIYIGYDNADGRALGRSKVFAEVLNAHGISAYDDAACD
jgi:hypothetical protein